MTFFCHPEQCHPELVSGSFQGLFSLKAKNEIATGTTCTRNGVWLCHCEAALLAAVAVSYSIMYSPLKMRLPRALRATCRRQGKECAMAKEIPKQDLVENNQGKEQNEEEKSKERDYKKRKRFLNSLLLNLFFKFLFFNHF